jgi:hypothetical protein
MEELIPIIAILCLFGLPVMAFMLFRVLSHRERMEMIRRGMSPQTPRSPNWTAPPPPADLGMNVAAGRKGKCRNRGELEPPYVTLRKGIQLSMVGLALTIGLSFIGLDNGSIQPGPWLLGGLIPMFVGLAQVILALLSGATLAPVQHQWSAGQPQPPPQFGGSGSVPGQPTYDTSYTYRPGDLQELQPPASPPERR